MSSASNRSSDNKQSHRRWLKRGIFALLGLVLVGSIVIAMLPKAQPVAIAKVVEAPMQVTVEEDGRTRVKDRYLVSTPLAGNLARLELQAGDAVRPGDVVAHLLPLPSPLLDPRSRAQAKARVDATDAAYRQSQAAEARARAALGFAESEIEKLRTLAEKGSITQQRVQQAEFEVRTKREEAASARFGVRVAQHEKETARAAVSRFEGGTDTGDHMSLTSPVEGVVLELHRESEGVVAAGAPLIEIGNPAALEIVVDVLTTDAVRIKAGAGAAIERWGGDRSLRAHVRHVEPKAFTRMSSLGVEEQRVNVVLDLDEPRESWSSLGDGFRVEASIVAWKSDAALQVPASAVFREGDKWMVYLAAAGVAKKTAVEVGRRNGRVAEVLGGLEPGQEVILYPGERVKDGMEVVAN